MMLEKEKIELIKHKTLNSLRNQKAVEHNDLITSVAKMDNIPLKIFELAVSCLDTDNPPRDNIVSLSKEVIFSYFDVSSTSKHSRFKNALTTLHQQSVFEIKEEQEKGRFRFAIISPIASSQWNDYNDNVKIKFTEDIMPYLIELKTNFTQYVITDIMDLQSKYSVIIYKWLTMHFNQYDTYKDTKKRTQEQLEQLKNPVIDIRELRRITNTQKKYDRMYDFEKNILETAKKEINEYTHFDVEYEKIKKGRTIEQIKFHVDKKYIPAPLPYKDNDPEYQRSILEKEEKKEVLYTQAMQNEYTTILGENLLITFKDMQNINLMADLQQEVYPLYDKLKEKRGLNDVKKHIEYVHSKQYGFTKNKQNISKYLKKSIEQYLQKIKLQDIK